MRALALVLVIAVFTSILAIVPASADRDAITLGSVLKLAAGVILVDQIAKRSARQAPQSQSQLYLRTSPQKLGNLLIKQAYGQNTEAVATGVLGKAGWDMLDDRARQAVLDEQRQYGGTGQVAAADYFAYISADFKDGREYDESQRGRTYSSGSGGREVICVVSLMVGNGTHSYSAQGVGSSWSRYDRFDWNSCRWDSSSSSYTPSSEDLALLAAMVDASNGVLARMPAIQAPAPAASGSNGAPRQTSTPAGAYCPACGVLTPVGANFCPACGAKLSR